LVTDSMASSNRMFVNTRDTVPWRSVTDQQVSPRMVTHAGTRQEPTSAWPTTYDADYHSGQQRIRAFEGVVEDTRARAQDQLSKARSLARSALRRDLPGPWVFATDDCAIEFEWEIDGKSLIITIPAKGHAVYYASQPSPTGEIEKEGEITDKTLVEAIRSLLGV